MLNREYPTPPMSAIPEVLLEAFLAQEAIEADSDRLAEVLDEVDTQRTYALYEGALVRARSCGGLAGHDMQAAAILAAIDRFNDLLSGAITIGGQKDLHAKLTTDELGTLNLVHEVLVDLLDWHFQNGAGRLLPLADWLGLVRKER